MDSPWSHDENGCEPLWTEAQLGFEPKIRSHPELWRAQRDSNLCRVTNECWGGTFSGGRLQVYIYEWSGGIKVFVAGNDDTYVVREARDRAHAEAIMRRVPMVIQRHILEQLGFGCD